MLEEPKGGADDGSDTAECRLKYPPFSIDAADSGQLEP